MSPMETDEVKTSGKKPSDALVFFGATGDLAYKKIFPALHAMTKHMLNLFSGRPGARLFRRHLSEYAVKPGADIATLRDALAHLNLESDLVAA